MPLELRVTLNAAKYSRKLKRIAQGINPVTPMLVRIGAAVVSWSKRQFDTGGRDVGGWKPLSPNTVAAKGHGRILINSGLLYHSIEAKVIPGARVQIGTDVPWARFHQEGTKPYPIDPVRSRFLSFITTGGRVFVRHVNHPGVARRRFLPNQTELTAIAKHEVDEYLKELTRGD